MVHFQRVSLRISIILATLVNEHGILRPKIVKNNETQLYRQGIYDIKYCGLLKIVKEYRILQLKMIIYGLFTKLFMDPDAVEVNKRNKEKKECRSQLDLGTVQ